jgi:hypothetical protein
LAVTNKKYCSVRCGNKVRFLAYELRNPDRVMLNRARQRSTRDGLSFSLDLTDISIPDTCPVLGLPLKVHRGGRPGFFPDSPSLDRLDNSKGYEKGNVRVISSRANALKSNATVDELTAVLADLKSIESHL